MSSVRLKEDKRTYVRDSDVLQKQGNSLEARCNASMVVSIVLFLVNISLALYVFGLFDNSSEDSKDTAGDLTGLYTQNTLGDEYLTGSKAPNMLFLLADDIGWADISLNGGLFPTPNIDELVEGGIQFTNFHTHEMCTPSRAAFLTGRLVWKVGLQFTHVPKGLMTAHLPLNEITWAEVTKEMGYDNHYVGRWGLGYASWDYTPLARGFDTFAGYFGSQVGYYLHRINTNDWPWVLDFWDNKEPGLEWSGIYSEDIFLEKTLQHLAEANKKGKPFTLTYGSQTVHTPITNDHPTNNPPVLFPECEQANSSLEATSYYCNKIMYLDNIFGVIIDYLKETGMWDNMLIFTTSDNGALPYTGSDWSGWGCNWPFRGGKETYYEGGIRNWFGITGGLVPQEYQGTTFDELTHISDIAATAMRLSMTQSEYEARGSLTGTSKSVDGINLWAFEHHELLIYNVLPQFIPSMCSEDEQDSAATDGEWKFIIGTSDSSGLGNGWYNYPGLGLIDAQHDQGRFGDAGGNCTHGCLFHIVSDKSEYYDLSMDYPEITDYFNYLLDAIHRGGFDDSYHPGQPFEYDYRGLQADGIMRPYLNPKSFDEYRERSSSTTSNDDFNYGNFSVFWIGEYDDVESPY